MDIEVLTQPTLSNTKPFALGEEISKLLSSKKPKFKTANFMFSLIKANAIDILKPSLKSFIDNGGTINFYVDSDKRFLSNPLISELIGMGCNIFTYINASSEFQYRGIVLESSKTSEIFFTSGNLSLNGLYKSHNIITHISFNTSTEKEAYKEFNDNIFNSSLTDYFVKVTNESLPAIMEELKNNISIPTISDFTKNDLKTIAPIVDTYESNIAIEINDDVNFVVPEENPTKITKNHKEKKSDAPISADNTENSNMIIEYSSDPIYYGADEAIDVENLLFESKPKPVITSVSSAKPIKTHAFSSDELINEQEENNITESEIIDNDDTTTSKTTDLSKTSIFMFESPKITHKGICAGEIKVPTYIRDLIAQFWDWPTAYDVVGHAKIKSRMCKFNIIDTINPSETLIDEKTKLFQRADESSFTIYSSILETLSIEENDIIRLIKVSTEQDCYYTCEIIRKNAKEYPIWEQFCNQSFRSSSRKYGIM